MEKLNSFIINLRKATDEIKRAVAVEALNHYKDKFMNAGGSWEGEKWLLPKRKKEGPKKYKIVDKLGRKFKKRTGYLKGYSSRDVSRATLVGRGVLLRSIRYVIQGDRIIQNTQKDTMKD